MPLTDTVTAPPARQTLPAEERFATELAFLAAPDDRPPPHIAAARSTDHGPPGPCPTR